jgi:small subunit ribosomal protein S6e
MTDYKLVLADPKTGKCYQREVKEAEAEVFLGKMIGDKLKGDLFGLNGYEFKITGGSDSSGFPMRKDLDGVGMKKILIVSGVGAKRKRKGQRQRKTVRGNTIGQKTSQINLKIITYGKAKLDSGEAKPAEEGKAEEKPQEDKKGLQDSASQNKEEVKPTEEAKEETPKEEKPEEEKKAETEKKPKREVKKEEKAEEKEKPEHKEKKEEEKKPEEK